MKKPKKLKMAPLLLPMFLLSFLFSSFSASAWEHEPAVSGKTLPNLAKPHAANYLVVKTKRSSNPQKIIIPAGSDLFGEMLRLSTDPSVDYAEPDYYREPCFTPNDQFFYNQRNLRQINLENAWNITKGNPSLIVAVIDSGLDVSQPEFQGRIVYPYNAVTHISSLTAIKDNTGHGTMVSGILAAASNNSSHIAGILGASKLMPVKVGDTVFADSAIADGIKWAVDKGAKVINISLGGYEMSQTLKTAVDYAYSKNVTVVAATGNDTSDIPYYPAAYPNVIAVGGANKDVTGKETFSNYGSYIDVIAPSISVMSTTPTYKVPGLLPGFDYLSGTSAAAPQVAGLAGLILSVKPDLTPSLLAEALKTTAKDMLSAGWDESTGYGIVDAYQALVKVTNQDHVAPAYKNIPIGNALSNMPINPSIFLYMTEPVLAGPAWEQITLKDNTGNLVRISKDCSMNPTTLAIWPVQLNYNTFYTLTIPVGALKDKAGNLSPACTLTLTTIKDTVAPLLTDTQPSFPGLPNPPGVFIYTFNEKIVPGTYWNNITLKDGTGNSLPVEKTINNLELQIIPIIPLSYDASYTITVPAGAVKDLGGNALAASRVNTFNISPKPNNPAVLQGTLPQNNASVPTPNEIVLNFDKYVYLNYSKAILKDQNDHVIPVKAESNSPQIFVYPLEALAYNTAYTMIIPAEAITNGDGTPVTEDINLTFTTGGNPAEGPVKLPYEVTRALADPDKPLLYLTSRQDQKLIAYNYQTGASSVLEFAYNPDDLILDGANLYVALHHDQDGTRTSGSVAIVDRNSFKVTSSLSTGIDPYQLVLGKENILYVFSGSFDNTYMQAWDLSLKEVLYRADMTTKSKGYFNPALNRLYTMDTYQTFTNYDVLHGYLRYNGSRVYRNGVNWSTDLYPDPTGKYLINGGNGDVLTFNPVKAEDLKLHKNLGTALKFLASDKGTGKIYGLPVNQSKVYIYDNTFTKTGELALYSQGKFIFQKDGELLIITAPDVAGPNYRASFQRLALNNSPPAVIASSPAAGDINADPAGTLTVTFNEPVKEGTTFDQVYLTSNGSVVPVIKELQSNTLTLLPLGDLKQNTSYTIEIPAGALTDYNDSSLAFPWSSAFTTSDTSATEPALTLTNLTDNLRTSLSWFTVTGKTETGTAVVINGSPVQVDSLGNFQKQQILPDGNNTVTAVAINNKGKQVITRHFVVDTKPPALSLTSYLGTFLTSRSSYMVTGSTDPGAIVKINDVVVETDVYGNFAQNLNLIPGNNGVTVRSFDDLGNSRWLAFNAIYNPTVLTVKNPILNGLTNQKVIIFSGISDPKCVLFFNGIKVPTDENGNFRKAYASLNGINRLVIKAVDELGNENYNTLTFQGDLTAPVISALSNPVLSTNVSSKTAFTVAWAGSDPSIGSGIDSYEVQYREGGKTTWVAFKTGYKDNTVIFPGSPGKTYYFRVRAKDKAGNYGAWFNSPTSTIVPWDNNSLVASHKNFAGLFNSASSANYLGTLRYGTAVNSEITYRFTGNKVSLLGFKGPGRSKANIYIDGRFIRTIDTLATAPQYRQILFSTTWTTPGTHTIRIVNLGTKGRSRLDLDGIGVSSGN